MANKQTKKKRFLKGKVGMKRTDPNGGTCIETRSRTEKVLEGESH